MATNVFANNNEIVSKGADGKSVAAFPDVCWTPPAPPVGPIPIPYPNSTEDKDLDNGTTTVQIKDMTVCMGDTSYIAKSKGDEGATQSQQKNMLTSAIQGKGYFITSSQDVKVEGKGATRHLDTMTHNHGSPAGTPGQGEVSGVGSGGEGGGTVQSPGQPELIAVDIVREEFIENGTNLGAVYFVKNEDQKKHALPGDIIRIAGNTEDSCIQFVNLIKESWMTSLVAGEYRVNLPAEQGITNRTKRISSISMVGNELQVRIRYKMNGSALYPMFTVHLVKIQGSTVYSSNERAKSHLCRMGTLGSDVYAGRSNLNISTQPFINNHVENDISTFSCPIMLDMSGCSSYVVQVKDSITGKMVESVKIAAWRKAYSRNFYPKTTNAKNNIINTFNTVHKELYDNGIDFEEYTSFDTSNIEKDVIFSNHTTLVGAASSMARSSKPQCCMDIIFMPYGAYANSDSRRLEFSFGPVQPDGFAYSTNSHEIGLLLSHHLVNASWLIRATPIYPPAGSIMQRLCVGQNNGGGVGIALPSIDKTNFYTDKGPTSNPQVRMKVRGTDLPLLGAPIAPIAPMLATTPVLYSIKVDIEFKTLSNSAGYAYINSILLQYSKLRQNPVDGLLEKNPLEAEAYSDKITLSELMAHEVGHWLSLVPCRKSGQCPQRYPCPQRQNSQCPLFHYVGQKMICVSDNKNTLLDGYSTGYIGHSHQGGHCSCGTDNLAMGLNYDQNHANAASCIMFGQMRDLSRSMPRVFCVECKKALKKSLCGRFL